MLIVAGNATYKSHCVCCSVCRSVGPTFTFSMQKAFTTPAQLITAPAQPPATRAAVYTALFSKSAQPEYEIVEKIYNHHLIRTIS